LIICSSSGCINIFFGTPSKPKPIKGFDDFEKLTIPEEYEEPGRHLIEPLPEPLITAPLQEDYEYTLEWQLISTYVYVKFGGAIKLSIINECDLQLFVYQFGIVPDWLNSGADTHLQSAGYFKDVGCYVATGEKVELGALWFDGPELSGDYNYSIAVSILVQDFRGNWHDRGSELTEPKLLSIKPLHNSAPPLKMERNIRDYYNKINALIDPEDTQVRATAVKIAKVYSGRYNTFQLCAIFDYVSDTIQYVSDPLGIYNYWASPRETIELGGGDCEDIAVLVAALINAIGGTVRVYMTENHAFVGVYIGDTDSRTTVIDNIIDYYGAKLEFVWLEDKFGSWLIADPLGARYLGGLPLHGVPVERTFETATNSYYWSWTLTDTTVLYSIDIVTKAGL
jgi:transglutaminase-like putative cysteine protease